ncbi:MAG: Rrf2 family transcriptional regulator [Vicinamibacteria bacterium]|nr:Rrf2 family transcriptional regulator [Vicinamibacteria bacterium]
MKFSAQEEYGLRCLMQLARHGDDVSLTIPQLARLEGITSANAAKMMRMLRRTGFVKSTRGQAGGYALARPSDAIVIGDVLVSLGSPLFDDGFCDRHSGAKGPCAHIGDCSLRPLLRRVQDAVDQVMGRLTLRDLLHSEVDRVSKERGAVSLTVVSASTRTAER